MSIASEWRKIPMYEDLYEVSSDGDVRSVDRAVMHTSGKSYKHIKGKQLSGSTNKKTGYKMVSLYKNGKGKTFLIHRLVALAFPDICGSVFDGCDVDHINTVRTDNRAINLRVCTRSENHLNPITNRRMREVNRLKRLGVSPWNKGIKMPCRMGENHPRHRAIIQYDTNGEYIERFGSIADASRKVGIKANAISNNLSGRYNTCSGYVFRYEGGDSVVNLQ